MTSRRAANFTSGEEATLLLLIDKYKDKIENKKTDAVSNTKKVNAWKDLQREFNNICRTSYREAKTLKNKYENIKKRAKMKFSHGRRKFLNFNSQSISTKVPSFNEPHKEVCEMEMVTSVDDYANNDFTENDNVTVCDIKVEEVETIYPEDQEIDNLTEQRLPEIEEYHHQSRDKSIYVDWTDSHSHLIPRQSKISQEKRERSNQTISENIQQWAKSKTDLEEIKKRCLEEEHTLKMKHLQEEHERKMALLDLQKDITLREHKIKMEILLAQRQQL